jgi:hypothetical protein
MFSFRPDRTIRIGFLIAALAYFSFSFYESTIALLGNTHPGTAPFAIWVTDTTGLLGMGFRVAAGFVAVLTALFFVSNRDLSWSEALMSLRWIVILEGTYWFVTLFPVAVWGIDGLAIGHWSLAFTLNTAIPTLFASVAIPVTFAVLFLRLNEKNLFKTALKWGLIAGTICIYAFWISNLGNWLGVVVDKGISYVTLFPGNLANLFSFLVTSVCLLALALFATYYTAKYVRNGESSKFNFRTAGAIITFFGLYFDVIYVLWIIAGSVGGWSNWYAWFLGHNADLWIMTLPMLGIPLMLKENLQNKALKAFVFLTQGVGSVFFGIFLSAYVFALPTNHILHGETSYRIVLGTFGGLLIILTVVSVILAYTMKRARTTLKENSNSMKT